MKLPAWLFPWRRKAITAQLLGLDALERRAKSGVAVTWQTALQATTVLACARLIAEGIAQVPLKLYQEDGRTRLPATEHPLYDVLHRRPNRLQTSFEYREMLGLHLVLTSDAFSLINRVNGAVIELLPLEPQTMRVERNEFGVPSYVYTNPANGRQTTLAAQDVWHIRGPSWNGYLGLQAVQMAREAIGLALVAEETHASFHRNGARPSGVLSVEGVLSKEQFEQLRAHLEQYIGSGRAGVPMIADRSAKWMSAAMSGMDAEHLNTRRFQVEEICRALRVMPIMVGYSDKASTYASAEQMFLAHVVHTLAPWYERIEQSICAHLLTDADREAGIYAKFVVSGLLRGSLKDTKDVLLGYVNGGLMTPNEAREKLELNPDGDPKSDELRIPANIVGEPSPEPPKEAPAGA